MDEILPEFVGTDFQNRWIEDLPEEDYHADKSSVSSGGVRLALESKRAFHRGVVLGNKKPPTPAMNFGKAAHLAILEPNRFMQLYKVLPDFGDMRSTANRAKRDAWKSDHPPDTLFLTQDEYRSLQNMIQAVQAYRDRKTGSYSICELLKRAVFERSGYFRDPETGLKCRIRPDILMTGGVVMPDLKTSRTVDRWSFAKSVWDHGYYIQLAMYQFGIKLITGVEPRIPCFIVVQNCEPFDVAMYPLDTGAIDRGQQAMKVGLRRIAEGIETGDWHGVQVHGAEDISLPSYTDWVPMEEQ